jgi:hypothetical protein
MVNFFFFTNKSRSSNEFGSELFRGVGNFARRLQNFSKSVIYQSLMIFFFETFSDSLSSIFGARLQAIEKKELALSGNALFSGHKFSYIWFVISRWFRRTIKFLRKKNVSCIHRYR